VVFLLEVLGDIDKKQHFVIIEEGLIISGKVFFDIC